MAIYEVDPLKSMFNSTLSQKELADMKATMAKLIPLYEAWRDAGYPSDGRVANTYYAEILRHVSKQIAKQVNGFIDAASVALEIKGNILMEIKAYVPTLEFTPLMFSTNLIRNRIREYYRTERVHTTVHYDEAKVRINKALIAAGYSQGINTEDLDVATVQAIVKLPMSTVANTMALLAHEGFHDSLEDYKARGVKENDYLPDNYIGDDPFTKLEQKEENDILYKALNQLSKLEKFILILCGTEGKTAEFARNRAIENAALESDIAAYCDRKGRGIDSFSCRDVSTIFAFAKDKMKHLLTMAHHKDNYDIFQSDKEETIEIQASLDDIKEMLDFA